MQKLSVTHAITKGDFIKGQLFSDEIKLICYIIFVEQAEIIIFT